MHVVASFEYSTDLELALSKLERIGLKKENIIAIPLEELEEKRQLIDTIHDSDGSSILDLGFVFGTIFMLLGAIYGFVWKWGPILWGLIGLIVGMIIGIIIKLIFIKTTKIALSKSKKTEVFVVVNCSNDQKEEIKKILFKHSAQGVGFLDK